MILAIALLVAAVCLAAAWCAVVFAPAMKSNDPPECES